MIEGEASNSPLEKGKEISQFILLHISFLSFFSFICYLSLFRYFLHVCNDDDKNQNNENIGDKNNNTRQYYL